MHKIRVLHIVRKMVKEKLLIYIYFLPTTECIWKISIMTCYEMLTVLRTKG